jgi:anti-anti-sigma regulatory factor
MITDINKTTLQAKVDYNILSTSTAKFQSDCKHLIVQAKEASCDLIELDLTAVTSVDSRGLDSIVSFTKLAEANCIKIQALIANPFVSQIFKLTRIEQFLPYSFISPPGAQERA